MFAVRVELLGGAYRASSFDDRREAEWPPHPARLFYAAVAAVHDNVPPVDAERDALSWWEGLGAPNLHLGPVAAVVDAESQRRRRAVVDHYVPGNYASSWSRDVQGQWQQIAELEVALAAARAAATAGDAKRASVALDRARTRLVDDTRKYTAASARDSAGQAATVAELLPENRNRQPRQFPAMVPDDPVLYLSWPDAEPGQHAAVLDTVLARIARIGHSASTVTCTVVDSVPAATLVPTEDGGTALRTVAAGVLDALERDFARHQGTAARVLPALLTDYAPPTRARGALRRPTSDAEWIVLTLPRGQKVFASRALELTTAVRAALVSHAAEPVAPFISGHEPGPAPTPPTSAAHIGAVPLLDATNPHSDGAVHGVAITLPPATTDSDRQALTDALTRWQAHGDGAFPVTLPGGTLRRFDSARASAGLGATRRIGVTDRSFWAGRSQDWASVAPVALDRYPKARPGSDAYARQTGELIARACRAIGLPEPVDVACSPVSSWAAAPPVHAAGRRGGDRSGGGFPAFRTRSGIVRHTVHVRILFAEAVGGPIVLGAGRFFGYGLLYPVRTGKQARS